ncbi:MAG: hypothetical protein DRK00_02300 [Thermoprotei archaeon]|nr:MAG: hypothetical protein DRK00_02300 [Thermoprotei archaeon]
MRLADYLKIGLAILLSTILARVVYSMSPEAGWLTLSIVISLAVVKLLADRWSTVIEFRRARRRAKPPRVLSLHRLLKSLPKTSNALCYILRGMLLEKISLRTELSSSALEEYALEYVSDEKLRKLLKGELQLRSRQEVDEIIDRLRRL